jgi:hypothetical protein
MGIAAYFCKHSTLSDCAILYKHQITIPSRYPLRQYNFIRDILKSVIPLCMEVPVTFNFSTSLNLIRIFWYLRDFNINNIKLTQ